jgi:deoxyribose-phosphate aldolase
MRAACGPNVQINAAGGVRDLDGLIKVRDCGCSRCGASATAAILDEYRRREAAEQRGESIATATETGAGGIGAGGY